jgi:hypothetical protein
MVETMDLCPKMSNICRKVCTYCQNPTSSRCVPLPKISQAKLVFSAEAALKLNQRSIRDGRVTCTTPDLTGLTNQFLSTLLSSQAVALKSSPSIRPCVQPKRSMPKRRPCSEPEECSKVISLRWPHAKKAINPHVTLI